MHELFGCKWCCWKHRPFCERWYGKLLIKKEKLKKANPEVSVASWAIKFAANLDGVITVLSGMSNIEQMEDNISYMKDFTKLSEDEENTIKEAQEVLKSIPLIPCTTC